MDIPAPRALRIAILLPEMRGGGVERVRLLLAAEFLRDGHQVEFVLFQEKGPLLSEMTPGCTLHILGCDRVRKAPLKLAAYLRRARPDVLLAAMWPVTGVAVLANLLSGKPSRVLVSEHNDLRHAPAVTATEKKILKRFGKWIYARADAVITVSDGVRDSLMALTGMARANIVVINNPIRTPSSAELDVDDPLREWWKSTSHALVAVGSLKRQKGYDVLLGAMALLRARGVAARLLILGEGAERAKLEALIGELNLGEVVRLPGFFMDPFPFLHLADLFVLSSRWEGFPNVLTEALTSGTPIVSTDCPSGPAEVLAGGEFGALVGVDDVSALTDAIETALSHTHDRAALIRRASEFSPAAAARRYVSLMA